MLLSEKDILGAIDNNDIAIDPGIDHKRINSSSVDLLLGNHFKIFQASSQPFIDIGDGESNYSMSEHLMEDILIENNKAFFLQPGQFALAITYERIELANNIVGILNGRSSIGRLGLMIHVTAHLIDAGFRGNITLELVNAGPLTLALRPMIPICAIAFMPLSSPTDNPYYKRTNAKYHDQKIPVQSLIHRD